MHVDLTGHHVTITDSLRTYVDEKMQRIERHFDQITDAHMVLTVEKLNKKAEATLKLRGTSVFAEVEAGDMYAAIDQLIDKLDRQVRKFKEKSTNHPREGRHANAALVEAVAI